MTTYFADDYTPNVFTLHATRVMKAEDDPPIYKIERRYKIVSSPFKFVVDRKYQKIKTRLETLFGYVKE